MESACADIGFYSLPSKYSRVPEAFEGTINRESGKISTTPRVHKEQTKKENLKE
ncbi:uncharacterized protein DS421_9g268440 [Arachis hypogaea]|nr:uncharacterized protein DS421_9g268440 [Arachis hypogaea]